MSEAAPTGVAIYDLDRTITRIGTWTPFLIFAARRRAPWRLALIPLALLAALAKRAGLIDRGRLKEVMQRIGLGRIERAAAARLAGEFAAKFAPEVRGAALDRIAADRAAGRAIVVATAAYGFYAEAFAATLGIGHVVATRARTDAWGRIVPRIDGENCYGAAKLTAIRAALTGWGLDTLPTRFYSDHVSDVPTLDWADEAFAVSPSPALAKVAEARGWTVLDWS